MVAKAIFPSNIINQESGSIIIQVYMHSLSNVEEQTICMLANTRVYAIGNIIDIEHQDSYTEFPVSDIDGVTLDDDYPQLALGYNTIVVSWEGSSFKLIVHNKQNTYFLYKDMEEGLNEDYISLDEEFSGTYTVMQTSYTSIVYDNESDLLELGNRYTANNYSYVINQTSMIEDPHPFKPLFDNKSNIFYRDFRDSNVRYAKKPYLEATPAPTDNSPIIVEDDRGLLYRQFFFDKESGEYSKTNTETFVIDSNLRFSLSYEQIDPDYPLLIILENGERIDNYTLENNDVFLHLQGWQHDLYYGQKVEVTYKLDHAYHIEWNEDVTHYSYKMQMTDEDTRPVTIIQEGNSKSPVRLATELELNPIVNSQHTGFIYIDKEEQHTQDFRLNVSSNYLIMDGMDSADFTVEAIDQYGNEVLSPYLSVFITDTYNSEQIDYGYLVPIITEDTLNARNSAGRVYFKYKTPLYKSNMAYKEEMFLNVYDRKSGLGAQIPMRLRSPITNQPDFVNQSQEISPAAALPFEYFARFYKRIIPENHPIHALDYDGDGYLSREDWLKFKEDLNNTSMLEALSNELMEGENFSVNNSTQ